MVKFYLVFFLSLILLGVGFPHDSKVFAATSDNGFNFNFLKQKFSVSKSTVDSWQQPESIKTSNVFKIPPDNLSTSLLEFIGQPVEDNNSSTLYHYNLGLIYTYVATLAGQINQKAEDPILDIQNNQAVNFTPPQTGIDLDVYNSSLKTLAALELGQASTELVVYQTQPKTLLSQTNNLGINELIAEGVSKFNGSPNNRRHNIAVGTEKFKGLIIPQGAEFSFNKNLGPVEAEEGFLPELVIDNGTTQPELGGGLCQVSTTTFRAAMAGGLPITARRNHAYAVQYYSPQGTDATIYPGSADLKFINDTPGAILIWPYEKDSNTLVFDFYGTNDGRTVTLEKPVVYDRKPDGSMKADWTREIKESDGEIKTAVFKSVYQSPALFHKTEAFVPAATNTPTSTLH